MSKDIVVISEKMEQFIATRRDFMDAFALDLNTDRITTDVIWETAKKCRAMSNLVSKYLADTEILLRNIEQRRDLSDDTLEDAIIEWIAEQPPEMVKKYAKDERRRVALIANKKLREELRHWKRMFSDIAGFKKTLVMAMENIRGARKDILASIGAAKLDNSWDPGALQRDFNPVGEAIEREERL